MTIVGLRPLRLVAFILCVAGSAPGVAAAEPPAGIVMQVSGKTIPPLHPRSEIAAGTPIGVPPGARLVFLHYRACALVAVVGGTVTLDPSGFDDSQARIESKQAVLCPRVHRLSAEGGPAVVGGALMRGVPAPLRLPAQLDLVVTGRQAGNVIFADIVDRGGRVLTRGNARSLRATLRPEAHFWLRITLRGRSDTLDIPFTTLPSASNALFILGLD